MVQLVEAQSKAPEMKETTVSGEPSMRESDHGSFDHYIDPVKERRMMRKFDVSLGKLTM